MYVNYGKLSSKYNASNLSRIDELNSGEISGSKEKSCFPFQFHNIQQNRRTYLIKKFLETFISILYILFHRKSTEIEFFNFGFFFVLTLSFKFIYYVLKRLPAKIY